MTTAAHQLHNRIVSTIRAKQLFKAGDTLIIAISGGADSTALLDLFTKLPEFSPQLVAAHLNHCLRGRESDSDEEFARNLAASYGIPFESRRVEIGELAARQGRNLEDTGRRARLAFFEELRNKWQATAVVLAHHADDQAETVLMRILRGAGASGLTGMQYRSGLGIIRPLLDITRAEIEAYLAEQGLTYREDSSNRDQSFLRNRIRHELLPLLEGYNPAIRERLGTAAALLADEDALLEQLAEQTAERTCTTDNKGLACDIYLLSAEPPALRRRVFRLALERLTGNLDHFTSRHIMALEHLADSPRPNATLDLPQGITAVREYGSLLLHRISDYIHETGDHSDTQLISGPGAYQLPNGARLTISTATAPDDFSHLPPNTALFDLDRAPFPWHVRTFQPGDRIVPLGMNGSKKVKELFIEAKIPVSRRRQVPLLFSRETLIWVCGLRTSQLARIDGTTSRMVSATHFGN